MMPVKNTMTGIILCVFYLKLVVGICIQMLSEKGLCVLFPPLFGCLSLWRLDVKHS